MLIKAKGSAVFHTPDCRHVKAIRGEKIFFATEKDARVGGGRFCAHCCPLYRHFLRGKRKEIAALLAAGELKITVYDNMAGVTSASGSWRIMPEGANRVGLFHKNVYKNRIQRVGREKNPIETGFHRQKIKAHTLPAVLRYILSHDEYREKNPMTKDLDQKFSAKLSKIERSEALCYGKRYGKKKEKQLKKKKMKTMIQYTRCLFDQLEAGLCRATLAGKT